MMKTMMMTIDSKSFNFESSEVYAKAYVDDDGDDDDDDNDDDDDEQMTANDKKNDKYRK